MKKYELQSGFTLIEMIATISIMAILLSLILVNFGSTNQERNVKIGRDNLISNLHKVQSYSLSSKDIAAATPAGSYGISFDTTSSNNKKYLVFGENTAVPPLSTALDTVNLPPNVYIKSIAVKKANGTVVNPAPTTVVAYFEVPYGRVAQTYNGTNGVSRELNDITTITLSSVDNSQTITVIIDGISGSVSSQ